MHLSWKKCIGIISLLAVTGFAGLHIFYYEHTGSPKLLAEKLVQEKRSSKDCFLFRTFDILFRPTTYEQQMRCIREYAQIAKDPSACELIMPSEYGLSCINNLWPIVLPDDGCGWDPRDATVYQCRHDGEELIRSKNCNDFKKYEKQYSACVYDMAENEKNLEKCANVPDSQIRAFCEARIGAWEKYPQLRGSSYFGTAATEQ